MVIATDFTEFSTSLENGVGRNSTPLPTSQTQSSYSLVVEHIHGKDTAQVRFLVGAPQGRMPKLVDGHGSGPCVARRESSSLSSPTTKH